MATIGCGISRKDTLQTNAATTKQKQQRNNASKPKTNTFSKYCKDNTYKKSLT
jgi:hypothetical protein